MAIAQITDANGWPVVLVLMLEEIRRGALAHLDVLIARIDDLTDRQVDDIRTAGARLGIDPARIEREVDAFVRQFEPERDWFVRQRHAVAAGITAVMAEVEPPQV